MRRAGWRYAAALAAMVDELDGWIARHDARIDAWHEGILYARAGDWQPGPDDETFRLLAKHGYADRLRRVDAAEARAVADSPRFVGGVVTPDLTVLQPGKLARELRRVLLERGVRIFEGTPMVRVEAGRPPRVVTPAGCRQRRQRRRSRTARGRRGSGTSAAPSPSAPTSWSSPSRSPSSLERDRLDVSHMGVADLREMLYYLRRTADDRIAIGGGAMGIVPGARIRGRVLTSPRLAEAAAHGLTWLFPQLEGVRFDAAWSGPMDITGAALPFFESAPGGRLHAGLGFSGHGLTSTRLGGKILASLVLRADDEWSRLPVVGPPLTQLPPEPLRWPLVQTTVVGVRGERPRARAGPRPGLLPPRGDRRLRRLRRAQQRHGAGRVSGAGDAPEAVARGVVSSTPRAAEGRIFSGIGYLLIESLYEREMTDGRDHTAEHITEATRRLDVALSSLRAASGS